MELTIKIVGFVSAILTTSSFLPQAIKTWRTRSTADLSPLMFTLFTIGILGWLFYGIFIHDLPMILANSVTIVLAGIIMYFILTTKIISKINHLGIYADNVDVLVGFYEKWFGAKAGELYENPAKKFTSKFLLLGTNTRLEIMHITDDRQLNNGNIHIAISVGSRAEVDRITTEMSNSGVTVIENPRITGDGFYESKILDPEGNILEVTI